MKYDFSLMKSKVIATNIIEKDNQLEGGQSTQKLI
jgi:hypothetical protein